MALDGVTTRSEPQHEPRFYPLAAPEEAELARLVVKIESRVLGLLHRRGALDSCDDGELLSEDPSTLALCYAASVAGRIALGPDAGFRITREGRVEGLP